MDDETKRVAKSKEKSVTFDQLANDFDIDKDNDEVFGDENESGKFPYFDNESLNLSLKYYHLLSFIIIYYHLLSFIIIY